MLTTALFAMCKVSPIIDPITITADTDGTNVIDNLGYIELMIIAHIGVTAATLDGSNYIELQLQHSNTLTDGDYVAVPNDDLSKYVTGSAVGTFALINADSKDNTVYFTAYKGMKRYVRLKINKTGTVVGLPIGVLALQVPSCLPANLHT